MPANFAGILLDREVRERAHDRQPDAAQPDREADRQHHDRDAQRQTERHMAVQARGWEATEFLEHGVSGVKDKRPELDWMFGALRRKRFERLSPGSWIDWGAQCAILCCCSTSYAPSTWDS